MWKQYLIRLQTSLSPRGTGPTGLGVSRVIHTLLFKNAYSLSLPLPLQHNLSINGDYVFKSPHRARSQKRRGTPLWKNFHLRVNSHFPSFVYFAE